MKSVNMGIEFLDKKHIQLKTQFDNTKNYKLAKNSF